MIEYYDPNNIQPEDDENWVYRCIGSAVGILLGLIFCALIGSCTTTKYVPGDTVYHTDTLRLVDLQHDSIYVHDSTYVETWLQGDTVYRMKYDVHELWRDRWVYDTIYQTKADSIVTTVQVEKKLSAWQKARLTLGNIFLALLALGGAYICYLLYTKLKQ